jgi:hypothetical protein
VDLATAKICVQWSTVDGEGISHIGLVDLETVPGKIRFGWPLTNELTAKQGPVTFAIRFFIKDEQDKFVYLFNTLSTSIVIRQGLNIINPDVTETDIDSLFGRFVQNSTNPTYPKPAPVYFNNNPGLNLLPQDKIDENDQLVMKAQAVVSDNGHIVYSWYFKEGATPASDIEKFIKAESYSENEKYYTYNIVSKSYEEAWPNEQNFAEGTYYTRYVLIGEKIDGSNPNYSIREVYEPIQTPEKRNGSEQYFVKDDEADAYNLVIDPELPQNVQLYERYTVLTIVPGGGADITGLYWVGASNYVGADSLLVDEENYPEEGRIYAINHTPEVVSTRCYVPTPDNVNITTDLPENLFMDSVGENALKATLKVVAENDTGLPKRMYSWYRNPDAKAINKDELGAFTDELVTTEQDKNTLDVEAADRAGWYYVHIDSELNRAITEATSKVCRVIEHTKAPILQKMEYAKWTDEAQLDPDTHFNNPASWTTIYDIEKPDEVIEMSSLVARRGEIIRLRVITDLDNAKLNGTGLYADSIEYKWHIIEPDKEARALDIDDIDLTNNGYLLPDTKYIQLGQNEIDIQCLENDVECHFFCVVENTLAGEKNSLEQSDYKVVFKVW